MGGRYLSTKISVKHSELSWANPAWKLTFTVSLIGAVAFFVFAIMYGYEAYYTPSDAYDVST